ncbi:MAG: ABC transporter ATP-binding protein [Nitrososphaerales archaeon]
MSLTNHYPLILEDVHKVYRIGEIIVPALQGVTLKVRKGEFLSIAGPSGSGKSTLLHIMGLLDRPSKGKVIIEGKEASLLKEREAARLRNEYLGFVFQAYNLINRMSALENVELPAIVKGVSREKRKRRAQELLSLVGLGDKTDRKPNQLSGGEQQRVAIARALMNEPSIILADEPTGNLDSKAGGEITKFFKKICEEYSQTIIVVTHNPEVAKATDRTIYLRDGLIVEERVNK